MPNPSFERDSPEAGCPSIQTLGVTMNLLRKIGALIFAASSALLALVAIIWGLSAGGVEHTIQNAREIENSFSLASGFVESFKKTHGHLPSEAEFTGWADTQPDRAHSAKGMRL